MTEQELAEIEQAIDFMRECGQARLGMRLETVEQLIASVRAAALLDGRLDIDTFLDARKARARRAPA